MIDWNAVDTVFLDMDGTLLDLHFDNHFWREHVPRRYAEVHGLPPARARAELLARCRSREGTLAWYCVEHWSRELGLDIAFLKREVGHLIAMHPQVVDFLEALTALGKRRVLVTNAHPQSLALKLEKTPLAGHFERIICSHDLGTPKEADDFWPRVQTIEPFNRARTLLIDDSPQVLETAGTMAFAGCWRCWHRTPRSPSGSRSSFPPSGTARICCRIWGPESNQAWSLRYPHESAFPIYSSPCRSGKALW